MAVIFDAVGPSSAGTAVVVANPSSHTDGVTSLSWSHTASGTNRAVYVSVALGSYSASSRTTTVTYGGISMTSVSKTFCNNGGGGYVQLFRLLAPATGAQTVAVTVSSPGAISIVAGSVSFTGVDQTTPEAHTATNYGSSAAASVGITSVAGNMVLDATANGSGAASSSQTNRWLNNADGDSSGGCGASSTAAGANSVTMSYILNNDDWGIIAVDIQAAAAPTVIPISWVGVILP